MKFKNPILILLSFFFNLITSIRNILFDYKIFKSKEYKIPTVSVGNLSVGGTGKSVLIDYLIKFFKNDFKVFVLSRGYKRKSKGIYHVNSESTVKQTGDEPLMLQNKNPGIDIILSESRRNGMEYIIGIDEGKSICLWDDAFQHRWVKPKVSILLTTFNNPFYKDNILPYGGLRENKKGCKRADIILVTKCPNNLDELIKKELIRKINFKSDSIFFCSISYGDKIISDKKIISVQKLKDKKFTLVTGIADPDPLIEFLKSLNFDFKKINYPDHHFFKKEDINKIIELSQNRIILTTEKDYVRLNPLINKIPVFYLPIKLNFDKNDEIKFHNKILRSLE
jgi:tetraacyldisaccharide 4'-kinase